MLSDERSTVKQDMDKVHKIAYQAMHLIGDDAGPLHWVSGQQSDGKWIGYGFVIGDGFAFVSFEDWERDIDDLALDCAEQVLGYTLYSKQDLERRLLHAQRIKAEKQRQMADLQSEIFHWSGEAEKWSNKLKVFAADESEGDCE